MPATKRRNPFYVVLLPVGVLFAVSACACGVMAVRSLEPLHNSEAGLPGWMERHGLLILLVELAVLAVLTVAAIGTDDYWMRRWESGGEEAAKQK